MRQSQKKSMVELKRQAVILNLKSLGVEKVAGQGLHNLDYSELKWHLALELSKNEGEPKC